MSLLLDCFAGFVCWAMIAGLGIDHLCCDMRALFLLSITYLGAQFLCDVEKLGHAGMVKESAEAGATS